MCKYLDISSRTIQRWRKNGLTDKIKGASKNVPKKLSEEEVSTIYKLLCSNEYKEMTPVEAFNSLLDKGIYHASSRSFYRILKRFNAFTHRTETKSGTSRSKPAELKAYAKNQIWMWDITWLKSPVTGIYYYAYVIEDLYDRSIVSWMIYENVLVPGDFDHSVTGEKSQKVTREKDQKSHLTPLIIRFPEDCQKQFLPFL